LDFFQFRSIVCSFGVARKDVKRLVFEETEVEVVKHVYIFERLYLSFLVSAAEPTLVAFIQLVVPHQHACVLLQPFLQYPLQVLNAVAFGCIYVVWKYFAPFFATQQVELIIEVGSVVWFLVFANDRLTADFLVNRIYAYRFFFNEFFCLFLNVGHVVSLDVFYGTIINYNVILHFLSVLWV